MKKLTIHRLRAFAAACTRGKHNAKPFLQRATAIASFLLVASASHAQMAVTGSGYGPDALGSLPPITSWATVSMPGAAGTFSPTNADASTTVAMDRAVQAMNASAVSYVLISSTATTPATLTNGWWSSASTGFIQTRPTGNAATLVMATLTNASGFDIGSMVIQYDLTTNNVAPTNEELPGHRVYYSLSGLANSWVVLGNYGNPVAQSIPVTFSTPWPANTKLYLFFVDDNASQNNDGSYQIDNFAITSVAGSGANVRISSPANGATFAQGLTIPVTASASMANPVTNVAIYQNAALIGNATTAPYTINYTGATVGTHSLTAVATDNTGATLASTGTVVITVATPQAPSVSITAPASGSSYLVGLQITNINATASGVNGTTVTNVEFYLDGAKWTSDNSSPYSWSLCDLTAGSHVLSAVAVDNLNVRGTNSITVTATNPPDVSIIVSNGSDWKYLDNGTDQGTAWQALGFDDSTWASGAGELGYGDGPARPERTLVGYGPDATRKYPTTYFRKTFNVANPGLYTNLIVRLLHDDHAVVYLNGTIIFNDITNTTTWDFTTYTPAAVADDGQTFTASNANPALLVAGANILAVEVHQDATNSSDLSFDLMLWGQGGGATGPKLTVTQTSPTQVSVSWDSTATGYTLQKSTTLLSGSWTAVGGVANPLPGAGSTPQTTGGSPTFFRLFKP